MDTNDKDLSKDLSKEESKAQYSHYCDDLEHRMIHASKCCEKTIEEHKFLKIRNIECYDYGTYETNDEIMDKSKHQYLNHNLNILSPYNHIIKLFIEVDIDKMVKLPDSIYHLKIGKTDVPINTSNLPKNLYFLKLCDGFNHTLSNLPESLKILTFDDNSKYDQSLDFLPQELKYLRIPRLTTTKINIFPLNLKKIVFYADSYQHILDNLPEKLGHLVIDKNVSIGNLPQSVKKVELRYFTLSKSFDFSFLHTGVKTLIFDYMTFEKNVTFDNLPNGLNRLKFSHMKNTVFPCKLDALPMTLKHLQLYSSTFNYYLDLLPPQLETLIIGCPFNQPLDNLPSSLKMLQIWCPYSEPLHNLPPKLTALRIYSEHQFFENMVTIPKNLRELFFYRQTRERVIRGGTNFLPNHIRRLKIPKMNEDWLQQYFKLPSKLKKLFLIKWDKKIFEKMKNKFPNIVVENVYR
jgi:hypothetical protein